MGWRLLRPPKTGRAWKRPGDEGKVKARVDGGVTVDTGERPWGCGCYTLFRMPLPFCSRPPQQVWLLDRFIPTGDRECLTTSTQTLAKLA